MFLTISYHLTFVNPNQKHHKVDVTIVNGQTCVYYNDFWNKAALYRITPNEEHEVISMITHYQGMGYTLTQFKRKRMTIKTWDEIIKERNEKNENNKN